MKISVVGGFVCMALKGVSNIRCACEWAVTVLCAFTWSAYKWAKKEGACTVYRWRSLRGSLYGCS